MPDPLNLAEASQAASVAENATQVPAELLLAQWALESGWGDHQPGQNCFGIKAYPGCYGRQLLDTVEWFTNAELAYFLASDSGRTASVDPHSTVVDARGRMKYHCQDWFATFPTLAACFERRAQMFDLGRYKPLTDKYREDGDLSAFAHSFGAIYATDPHYAETLLKISGQQNVKMALSQARGEVNA